MVGHRWISMGPPIPWCINILGRYHFIEYKYPRPTQSHCELIYLGPSDIIGYLGRD